MKREYKTSTYRLLSLVSKLAEAGMDGNRQRLELLSLSAIREFKTEFPELTEKLSAMLSDSASKGSAVRWQVAEPPPTDMDGGLALVRVQPVDNALEPIFEARVNEILDRFLRERGESKHLLQEGFAPPRTLLIKGAPGTGKTMLARWLAQKLNLRFVTLDLATSISSFLGKTGGNLRRSLDYARATPCVLLLDEFDAIVFERYPHRIQRTLIFTNQST